MIVTIDELKTKLDSYIEELVDNGEIVVIKDGRTVAHITPPKKDKLAILKSLTGIAPSTITLEEARAERLAKYETGL